LRIQNLASVYVLKTASTLYLVSSTLRRATLNGLFCRLR
jgi:hypothetical protein